MPTFRIWGIVILLAAAAGCGSPTGPSTATVETISGEFAQQPWVHSRFYSSQAAASMRIDVLFSGDYNDILWIDVLDGPQIVQRALAKGYFDPIKQVELTLTAGTRYELRIWTDKCCTRYTGSVTIRK